MKIKFLFLIALLAVSTSLSAQQKVYLPYLEVINMHHDYQYTLSKLLKTYTDDRGTYTMILPPKPDSLYPLESMEETRAKAKELGAAYFMKGEVNRINQKAIVNVSLYETESGKQVWSDILKALDPDDLDPIMQKVARNMGTENKANEDGDIYSVTEHDSRQLKKIDATYGFGITLGGAYTDIPVVSKNFQAGFGFVASYDVRKFILDIKGEAFLSPGIKNLYYFSFEGYHPLSDKSNSAFLGGGLGYSGMNYYPNNSGYDWEAGGGLLLNAGGGYYIGRNSTVGLRITGKAFVGLYDVGGYTPVGGIFTMSMIFKR